MSKIQDALKRIQASAAPARQPSSSKPPPESSEPVPVLGQLAEEVDDTGIRIIPDDGGLVAVDQQALRREGYLASELQERDIADQYRLIKRPLLDNAAGRGGFQAEDANLIMVTSSLPADGKTFTCINLALSMAREKDTSVLLVDADIAKPHISALFGVADQHGLIDLLKDKSLSSAELLVRTDVPGLSLLPAGSPDEHATELLASRRMKNIVHELSTQFPDRVVIFDSPPLLVTSESRVLADAVGQIAMVVRAGKTPQQAVLEAIDSLDEAKALNLVLNESSSGAVTDGYGTYGAYGGSMRESSAPK